MAGKFYSYTYFIDYLQSTNVIIIYKVYRNRRKRKWFIKAMKKKEIELSAEEIELLSKINPNMLYSSNGAENK